jgi:hypothetical protein
MFWQITITNLEWFGTDGQNVTSINSGKWKVSIQQVQKAVEIVVNGLTRK